MAHNNSEEERGIQVRPDDKRGRGDFGWLKTRHSFSFGEYYDPAWMGFRALRVINEDYVAPGKGFGTHPHKDMEILTYVIQGALEHKDSMGNTSVIKAGDVQKMTAGSGVRHSEYNPSSSEDVHLLQIWILPHTLGLTPSYQQITLKHAQTTNPLTLIASAKSEQSVIQINQDVKVYRAILKNNQTCSYVLLDERGLWVQIIKGIVSINNVRVQKGDGVSIQHVRQVEFSAQEDAEFLIFDMF